MSSFFSTIGDLLTDIWEGIKSLPSAIVEGIGDFFNTLWGWLNNLWEGIKAIPSNIVELLKSALQWLFVPEENFFTDKIEEFKTALNEKIPYQDYIQSLKDIESVTDALGDTDEITTSIDLSNYSVTDKLTINMNKFIDFSIFSKYKETWYSWIRVVVYIGLVIYNINQTIKFLRGFGITEGSIRDVQNSINSSKGSGNK